MGHIAKSVWLISGHDGDLIEFSKNLCKYFLYNELVRLCDSSIFIKDIATSKYDWQYEQNNSFNCLLVNSAIPFHFFKGRFCNIGSNSCPDHDTSSFLSLRIYSHNFRNVFTVSNWPQPPQGKTSLPSKQRLSAGHCLSSKIVFPLPNRFYLQELEKICYHWILYRFIHKLSFTIILRHVSEFTLFRY